MLLNTPFSLQVQARSAPRHEEQLPVHIHRKRPGPVLLEVEVRVPVEKAFESDGPLHGELSTPGKKAFESDGPLHGVLSTPGKRAFESDGPLHGVLEVPEEGNSLTLSFELVPRARGRFVVEVVFNTGNIEELLFEHEIEVVTERSFEKGMGLEPSTRSGRIEGGARLGEELSLTLDTREGSLESREFRINLSGPKKLLSETVNDLISLPRAQPQLLAQLCRDLTSQFRASEGGGAEAREFNLRTLGATLADQLLGKEVS